MSDWRLTTTVLEGARAEPWGYAHIDASMVGFVRGYLWSVLDWRKPPGSSGGGCLHAQGTTLTLETAQAQADAALAELRPSYEAYVQKWGHP